MKAYIKPCCTAVVIEPSVFVAASRAVEFSTGVHRTEYKDDLIDDIDGGSPDTERQDVRTTTDETKQIN